MTIEKHHDALRTIGEVANEIGVATHVLRFWETKFPQIKPQKRRGRRYYGAGEVAIIKTIKELLYEQGYTVKGVTKYLLNARRAELAARRLQEESASLPEAQATSNQEEPEITEEFPENNNDDFLKFNASQVAQLTEIYQGLSSAREKLKELSRT